MLLSRHECPESTAAAGAGQDHEQLAGYRRRRPRASAVTAWCISRCGKTGCSWLVAHGHRLRRRPSLAAAVWTRSAAGLDGAVAGSRRATPAAEMHDLNEGFSVDRDGQWPP